MNSPVITNHDSDAAERMKAMREIESEPSLGDLLRQITQPDPLDEIAVTFFPMVVDAASLKRVLKLAYLRGSVDSMNENNAKLEARLVKAGVR
jgi:hypothetical protein